MSGEALDRPEDTRTVEVEGTPSTSSAPTASPPSRGNATARTCVLDGEGVPDAKLAELAGWQAKGSLVF